MISTKGYFYFQHQNPKHNVKFRKHSNLSMDATPFQLKQAINKQKSKQKLQGFIVDSRTKRFNQKNKHIINISFNKYLRKPQSRLTFQKLQQILNESNSGIKKSFAKIEAPSNLELTEINEFVRKNSLYSQINSGMRTYTKVSKNKQLRDCLFSSQFKRTRPQSNMSYLYSSNRNNFGNDQSKSIQQQNEQPMISPSKNGVFVPSSKFKNRKEKSSKRYKTSYIS